MRSIAAERGAGGADAAVMALGKVGQRRVGNGSRLTEPALDRLKTTLSTAIDQVALGPGNTVVIGGGIAKGYPTPAAR